MWWFKLKFSLFVLNVCIFIVANCCLDYAEASSSALPVYRPIDGTGVVNSSLGKVGSLFIRTTAAQFRDGYSQVVSRLPARYLSNVFLDEDPVAGRDKYETVLFGPEELLQGRYPDDELNQLSVVFGQAITHDITKARITLNFAPDPNQDFTLSASDDLCQIVVEVTDVVVYVLPCVASVTQNEDQTKTVSLPSSDRYVFISGTQWTYFHGPFTIRAPNNKVIERRSLFPLSAILFPDDTNSTRIPINDVTSFLDLSLIYGSSVSLNSLLRLNDGTGRLRLADDGDLPFADLGEPNDCGGFDVFNQPISASGDSRVDENAALTAIHSIYFRSHNQLCDYVAAQYPELVTDDAKFEKARQLNIARFQKHIYEEYLPQVFGWCSVRNQVGQYRGHQPGTDPRISVEFNIASRVFHGAVLLPPLLFYPNCSFFRLDGTLGFPQFARPNCQFKEFRVLGGGQVLKGAILQSAQNSKGKVNVHMRNVIFRIANGQNSARWNLDIETNNINRAAQLGLSNFDSLRQQVLGYSGYSQPGCVAGADKDTLPCFLTVTRNVSKALLLQTEFRRLSNIEPFVGLISEDVDRLGLFGGSRQCDRISSDGITGPTARAIFLSEMRRIRDADPYFVDAFSWNVADRRQIQVSLSELIEQLYGFETPKLIFKVPTKKSLQYCTY